MQYNIIILPESEFDLDCAMAWYGEKRDGLGVEFLFEFEDLLINIKQNPFLFQEFFIHFHKAYLKRFPYAVYFSIHKKDKSVSIYAVLHNYRNPELFKQRIEDV